MAYTQAQLDALKDALARGVRTVSYDGQSVTYASLSEIERAIERVSREMGQSPKSTRVAPTVGRGFR